MLQTFLIAFTSFFKLNFILHSYKHLFYLVACKGVKNCPIAPAEGRLSPEEAFDLQVVYVEHVGDLLENSYKIKETFYFLKKKTWVKQ